MFCFDKLLENRRDKKRLWRKRRKRELLRGGRFLNHQGYRPLIVSRSSIVSNTRAVTLDVRLAESLRNLKMYLSRSEIEIRIK